MEFVNSIAKIVHMEVSLHGGAANKNIGDAFLLVWKFPKYSRAADRRCHQKQECGPGGQPRPAAAPESAPLLPPHRCAAGPPPEGGWGGAAPRSPTGPTCYCMDRSCIVAADTGHGVNEA